MQAGMYSVHVPFIVGFGAVQDDKVYMDSVLQHLLHVCLSIPTSVLLSI